MPSGYATRNAATARSRRVRLQHGFGNSGDRPPSSAGSFAQDGGTVADMNTVAIASSELRDLYARESARIQQEFSVSGEGSVAIAGRTAVVESILLRLWSEIISADPAGPEGFALVATGGFGRGWLFPHSDIDLLFLHSNTEDAFKDSTRRFSQELWDLRLKLSPTTRTLAECERL